MQQEITRQSITKDEFKKSLRVLKRYILQQKKPFLIAVLGVLLAAAAEAIRPMFIGTFFDMLTVAIQDGVSNEIWLYVGLISLVAFISAIGRWMSVRSAGVVRAETIRSYRINALDSLLSYPISFFKKQKTGEIHEIITRTESATGDFIGFNLPNISVSVLTLIFSIGFVFFISVLLGSILMIGLVMFYSLVRIVIPRIQVLSKQLNEALNEVKNDYFEIVTNIFEVKRNTTEEQEQEKVEIGYRDEFVPRTLKEEFLWANNDMMRKIVIVLTQTSLFVAAVILVIQKSLSPGDVVAIILYASMSFRPLYQLSDWWLYLNRTLIKVQEGEDLLNYEREEDGTVTELISAGKVVFDSVSFGYEDNEHALNNISFEVPAGSTVALVGESGAGKTTTIDLLGGYYTPNEGEIRIDDVSTVDYVKEILRSGIGYVSQEVTLFNDTIGKNIAYGAGREVSQKEIESAAKQAGAHTFISKLADGYDQGVGERGLRLSVGQKQRIAIARAFLRNPKILVLDEPTSALDAKTERHITDSLNTLMKDRTTVIIAHRLSTTRNADQILVFKDGAIIERGSHDELMDQKGEYAMMYNEHVGLS